MGVVLTDLLFIFSFCAIYGSYHLGAGGKARLRGGGVVRTGQDSPQSSFADRDAERSQARRVHRSRRQV